MVGPLEFVILALLIILIVGRNKLPEAGRSLGGGIRNFIRGVRDDDEDSEPEAIPVRSESDRDPPPTAG